MGTADRAHASGASRPPQIVTATRTYNVPPETAFDAWTNPASLEKWFGPPGFHAKVLTHDPRVGGAWRFLMYDDRGNRFHHFGSFVEIAPPRRLVFTWASEEQVEGWRDENGDPSVVAVDFAATETGVMVTVRHEKLVSERARRALTNGWAGGLDCLGEFFATAEKER